MLSRPAWTIRIPTLQRTRLPRHPLLRGVFAALLLAVFTSTAVQAQVLREEFWIPNDIVEDVAVANGAVYLAGGFTQVGPATGSFVGLDRTTAATLQPFPEVLGIVAAVTSDGAGGWYIGGNFNSVQGQPRSNLAHIDANGSLTDWNPGAGSHVVCLARDPANGIVYAGGLFETLGGQSRIGLGAITPSGAVTPWNAGFAQGSYVSTLAAFGGTLYAGGYFSSVAGQTRMMAAAFDATTAALLEWNPNVNNTVYALVPRLIVGFPSTVTVYLGGGFSSVGGQARSKLAEVDGVTGAVAPWNPGADFTVFAMALAGGSNPVTNPLRVYVGGDFLQIGGALRSHIAEITEGGTPASWNPGADGDVRSLMVAGSLLYVGGQFSNIGGRSTRNLVAIDRTTGVATNWDPMVGGPVWALGSTASAVFAGGAFWTSGGVRRHRLAALDLQTGQPTPWDPDADADAHTLAVGDGVIYAGGDFTTVRGLARNHLAALDPASGAPTGWAPNANQTVWALEVGAGVVYAGGAFTTVEGFTRSRIAGIDAAQGTLTGFDPGANGEVTALAVDGTRVYAGGQFTGIGGQPRDYLAALDAATGSATPWNPHADWITGGIYLDEIRVHGDLVIVGGKFDELGGRQRTNFGAVDIATGLANQWDHYTDGLVRGLAIEGGTIYVSGDFGSVVGQPRNGIAMVDEVTGELLPWTPEVPGIGGALAVQQGTIFAAGTFEHLHRSFAVFSGTVTAAAGEGPELPTDRLRTSPNPFRAKVTLGFALPRGGALEVTIHDLSGRLVRRLARGLHEAGEQRFEWNGRDEAGRDLGAGIYFARVESEPLRMTAKLLKVE